MNSTIFKAKHPYQQQQQQQQQQLQPQHLNTRSNGNSWGVGADGLISSNHNSNNQNSIFILNTPATNNILPNNHQLYYADFNENNAEASSPTATSSAASSSVWSSASATMCSPAAHALQKLFNCSSSSSYKFSHASHSSGIETKAFKSKSEILKKKSKFWKYLEDEDNDKNNQKGIEVAGEESNKKLLAKGFKFKSSNCSQFSETENRNQEDLSELLEYSCSLCDNCRCVDCQIGYFDCENSDDSNSEYSFHLSAYEEDDEVDDTSDNDNVLERQVDAADCSWQTSSTNYCTGDDDRQQAAEKSCSNCCTACWDGKERRHSSQTNCCQQCFIAATDSNRPFCITTRDH